MLPQKNTFGQPGTHDDPLIAGVDNSLPQTSHTLDNSPLLKILSFIETMLRLSGQQPTLTHPYLGHPSTPEDPFFHWDRRYRSIHSLEEPTMMLIIFLQFWERRRALNNRGARGRNSNYFVTLWLVGEITLTMLLYHSEHIQIDISTKLAIALSKSGILISDIQVLKERSTNRYMLWLYMWPCEPSIHQLSFVIAHYNKILLLGVSGANLI